MSVGDNTIAAWCGELSTLDQQIDDLQSAKRDAFKRIRDEHGRVLADAVKNALKLSRLTSEQMSQRVEIDAETDRILRIIESGLARRAPRAREIIEEFDPETGEVLDTSSPSDTDEVEGSKPEASASDGRVTPSAGTGGEEDRQPIQADHISDVPKMVVDENAGSVEEINLNASNSGAFVASTAPEEINEGLAGPANAPDAGTANTKPAHSVQPVSDVALKTGLTLPAADEAEPSPKVEASSAHRVMTMTPLEPREAGGLKGFGFTVKFEDKAAAWSVTYETTPPIAMRWHEFSAPFLNSDTAAHRDMLESVRQIGVQDPIIRSGDMILDGRRRYLAARELGVPYPVTEYQGTDPLADVIRWNLDSRSVSQAERKAIAKKFKAIPSAAHRMDEIAELLGIVGA